MKNDDALYRECAWAFREKYKGIWRPAFVRDIIRLRRGEPVDYVIGWVSFLGCRIDLSLRPFIPRPETEYWVERAIEVLKKETARRPLRILDLYAGSGCIGIAVASHLKKASVFAADADARCVRQCAKNARINGIPRERYRACLSRRFAQIRGLYDVIFANPPYISWRERKSVAASVLAYEPHRALFGGDDGLREIRAFLKEARSYLRPGGRIWMEFGAGEKRQIETILRREKYKKFMFGKDQYGRWRYVEVGLQPFRA